MGKKSSDKQRKSLFYKILVLVILLAFSVFLYCAEQDVTPVEALQYLLGQTELDQLPDMPAITDIPPPGRAGGMVAGGKPKPFGIGFAHAAASGHGRCRL